MILELDCGNSLIKWRVLDSMGAVGQAGAVDSEVRLLEVLRLLPNVSLDYCRLVSVRSDDETFRLIECLARCFSMKIDFAKAAISEAGVINGYSSYELLGLDRWLAILGAYHLAQSACLVLDLGTAITSDFIAVSGEHLGGYICPGMPLMRNQLRTHTRRIRYDETVAGQALDSLMPGRSTAEAVERGCSLMLRGFVLTQVELAKEHLGVGFQVLLTGGDASLVQELLPDSRIVSDLVFIGLAIACPYP